MRAQRSNLALEYRRKADAARTSAAVLAHQAHGRRMSYEPPYGWRIDPANPALMMQDAEEQQNILKIIQYHRQGLGLRKIARGMELDGIAFRSKPRWFQTTIGKILKRAGVAELDRPIG